MTARRVLVTARDGFPALPTRVLDGLMADGHHLAGVLVVRPSRTDELRRARNRRRGRATRTVGRALRRRAEDLVTRTAGRAPHAGPAVASGSAPAPVPVEAWALRHDVPCTHVGSIDAPAAVGAVRAARPDLVVYAGGGIIGPALLAVAPVVLNHHIGPLPAVRGNDPLEWSLLLGRPITVTIHRIDAGIDTGPVVEEIGVEVGPDDTLDDVLERCVALGVEGLRRAVRSGAVPLARQPAGPRHRQCFRVAPVLRDVLERRLADRRAEESA